MVERVRRSDILAAAEAEFGAAGFAGGRIERIAAAARVNKQLLFHYFGSKEGLFAAAVEALLTRIEPPEAQGSPAEELRSLLRFLEEASRKTPGLLSLLTDGQAPAAVRAWLSRMTSRAEACIADGQRRGYFRDDLDPELVSQTAVSAALWRAALGSGGAGSAVDGLILDYCAWR